VLKNNTTHMTRILGISAYHHDSAAALVEDGVVRAIDYCVRDAGVALGTIDYIVFYDKPLLKFERLLETYSLPWRRSMRYGCESLW